MMGTGRLSGITIDWGHSSCIMIPVKDGRMIEGAG